MGLIGDFMYEQKSVKVKYDSFEAGIGGVETLATLRPRYTLP